MPAQLDAVGRVIARRAIVTLSLISTIAGCTNDSVPSESIAANVSNGVARSAGLLLTTRDSSLIVGDTVTVLVEGQKPPAGSRSFVSFSFRSSDTNVVRISNSGVARAIAAGRATISVRSISAAGTLDLTVTNSPSPQPPPPTPPPGNQQPDTTGELPPFVAPQLPRATVNVDPPAPATRTVMVAAGDAAALQRALNTATAGDEIVLADGGVYTGAFRLPNRSGNGTVVIRSATVPVAAGTRITPSAGARLATLVATSVFPALATDDGAHGWRIIGVAMRLADGAIDNYGIVTLGSGVETSATQFPREIILDRVTITGSPTGSTSRCISLNGIRLAVINSWLSECHARGREAQAIAGWTGSGPLLIENNHLEGAGQSILFGGADPRVANVSPSDITIRRNHLFKPLSWAGRWTIKAAFEVKHADRLLFEANVIENHWSDAQVGFAMLLQTVSQDNSAGWTVVRDITIRLNAIRNSTAGINMLAQIRQSTPLQPTARVLIRDNSFDNVGRDPINGVAGRFLQLLENVEDVTVLQNTFFGAATASNDVVFDGTPTVRLVLANNVFGAASYGINGSAAAEGSGTLARYAPGSIVRGNVITGRPASLYPGANVFPATLSFSDFIDPSGGNFSLRNETGFSMLSGARTGVDGSAVVRATAGVTQR
jgi:hypothetical protein